MVKPGLPQSHPRPAGKRDSAKGHGCCPSDRDILCVSSV